MSLQAEDVVVSTGLELLAQLLQRARVVQLVAVHAERPRRGAGVRLEHPVRVRRVARALHAQVVELTGQPTQDLGRLVGRQVVDREDPVAECGHVPDCPLEVHVLVVDEEHAHDLHLSRRR